MRIGIFFIGFWLLSGASAWAQTPAEGEQFLADTRERIKAALENFEQIQSKVEEIQKKQDAKNTQETNRDIKIRNTLENLERLQLQPQERNSGEIEMPSDATEYSPEDLVAKPSVTIQGNIRFEVAHHIYSPSEFTKIKNQLSLTARGELSPALRYRISGRTYYDAAYDIGHYYSDSATSDQRTETELRDTYVDYSTGAWDLRVGKQQVVWGEAVGVFVADVVNAKDMREFLLPDFDNIRIPEWGTNLEYTHNNLHSEFIFLPGIEFDKLGVRGSEFAFPLPLAPDTPYTYHDAKEPKDGFENSKLGSRFNYLWEGFDMSVFYLHSWTHTPVLYRTINGSRYDFDPQYKRLDTWGAAVSKEIHDIVLKSDFVYTPDDYFSLIDPTDSDGIARSGRLEYLLGFDYTFFDKLDVNGQIIQNVILDHAKSMIGLDKFNTAFSLRISRDFLNRKLKTEFLMIYGLTAPDFLYQPKIIYNLTDSWQAGVGADVFSGNPAGTFGYFRNKSRYYSELTYKF